MIADGEAMRFVPHALQQLERRRGREAGGRDSARPGQVDLLFALGQPDQRQVGEARLPQDRAGRARPVP